MSALPSNVGLPASMMLGHLDNSVPPDTRSYTAKIQPSNVSQITTTISSLTAPLAQTAVYVQPDMTFPSQQIIFDLPCGASPSTFLDPRATTISFRATYTITTIGTTATYVGSFLRSGAYSFFDRMSITSQNGSIIEDITEYGLVNDTLIALQMNNAVRHGVANQYGFNVDVAGPVANAVATIDVGSQGHIINILSAANGTPANNQSESHSYSFPLVSGVVGVLNDKMLNIGRTSKLQVVLQTSNILPVTLVNNFTAANSVAPTITVMLDNFSLMCEYIDIGTNALEMLDKTLVDGIAYSHGTTYRSTTTSLPSNVTGSTSLLAGVRASSVKSLFARFVENGTASATLANGKYSSKNPMANSLNFNIGGLKYPQAPINPILFPAMCFRDLQLAIGSWNNAMFQSCVTPSNYCKLSAGGTASGLTTGTTQENSWSVGDSALQQAQFIFGENLETIPHGGLLSGLNCTSAPIFLELNIATAPTNAHTAYIHAMCDHILVHNVHSGDLQVRI